MTRARSTRVSRRLGSEAQSVRGNRAQPRGLQGNPETGGYRTRTRGVYAARIVPPVFIILAGLAAYSNSFSGAYVLDDDKFILHNPRIRNVLPLSRTLRGRRPVVDLSLAVNYQLAGRGARPAAEGFHWFNLAVHLAAGLTLFGIVRRTLLMEKLAGHVRAAAPWLAFVIALIWVVHPLQTQSVTYLVQRGESLMGLFYLLTLYCVIRGCESGTARPWHFSAVLFCALGMGTKGVMVTAPVMVLLYDRVFLAASFGELFRRRRLLYAGLALTWCVLVLCGVVKGVLDHSNRGATVGFGLKTINPLQYLLTQPGVIVHYITLSLWPHPLCLDYHWPVAGSAAEVLMPGVVIVMLMGMTVWGLARRTPLGFVGVWFFLILLPTSSFIPIKDPAFEHRMYLPVAAVIMLAVFAGRAAVRWIAVWQPLSGRRGSAVAIGLPVVAVVLLISGTLRRNRDYHDDLRMWRDVITKQPAHARGYLGLGTALFSRGEKKQARGETEEAGRVFKQAEQAFAAAVRFRPGYADAYYNLGNALNKRRKWEDALAAYRKSLELRPRNAKCHYNLGNTLKRLGRVDEAIASYRRAVELNPRHLSAHINLGNSLRLQGRLDEAVVEYHKALDINPRYANTHFNLGEALRQQGRLEEALERFELALRYKPNHAAAKRSRERLRKQLAAPDGE